MANKLSNKFNYPFNPLSFQAVPHDFTGDNQLGLYAAETTQRYVLGTRKLSWDGRVYKYCFSNNTCNPTNGAMNNTAPFIADDGTNEVGNSNVVGDTFITADSQTVAEDLLAGGFVIIYSTYEQFRGIVGNTAGAGT